jgi:hypothetical protein
MTRTRAHTIAMATALAATVLAGSAPAASALQDKAPLVTGPNVSLVQLNGFTLPGAGIKVCTKTETPQYPNGNSGPPVTTHRNCPSPSPS